MPNYEFDRPNGVRDFERAESVGGTSMARNSTRWRIAAATALASALTAATLVSFTGPAPRRPSATPRSAGRPSPQPPVGYSTGNMMQAIYNAESGGTDFWIDRLLARPGNDPSDADGGILMTRGRALFMKMHTPGTLGFAGQVAYIESISNQQRVRGRGHAGHLHRAGRASAGRRPSHWRSVHTSGSIRSTRPSSSPTTTWRWPTCPSPTTAASSTTLQLRATSPYATVGQRQRADRSGQRRSTT